MNILAIETSCDETSCAVVKDGRKILSNIVSSQIDIHKRYFGVVPELASRAHLENINGVLDLCLQKARITKNRAAHELDAVCYTRGPGLAGSLLVGQVTAQTFALLYDLPLVDVNHLEGHLYAGLLDSPGLKPPYLGLIVSGGHTELVVVKNFGEYRVLGETRDDAAGEAFDKVAKLLGLEYPGGPVIDRLSKGADPDKIRFPRPFMWPGFEFSFSGLKTAVVNHVKKFGDRNKAEICAGFQAAVVETLIEKTVRAAKKEKLKKVVLGGGVAANSCLRNRISKRAKKENLEIYLPSIELCTDNAAMIACVGYYKFRGQKERFQVSGGRGKEQQHLQLPEKIEPGMKLENWTK
jgi:N6-L-threonylcarbamoyladenine synthase